MEMLGIKSGSPVSITRDEIGLSERWPECSKAWTYLAVSGSPSSTVITLMTLGVLGHQRGDPDPGPQPVEGTGRRHKDGARFPGRLSERVGQLGQDAVALAATGNPLIHDAT